LIGFGGAFMLIGTLGRRRFARLGRLEGGTEENGSVA
jgi:hypothetical protein